MRVFKKPPKYNFLYISKYMIGVSLIFLLVGTLSLFVKGINPSIDFKGGTIINVSIFSNDSQLTSLREKTKEVFNSNINISEIQNVNNTINLIITMDYLEKEDILNEILFDKFGENYKIEQIESIGPKIGNELQNNARNAILVSLLLIGIYITIRFDSYYALGSLVALLHDMFFILGIFSIFGFEISVSIIAAFLTIAGYSLNDTIVIYDRIRENMLKFSRLDKNEIINKSLNETLNRTIVTSITTLMVVIVLYFFGGEVLQPFALALIIGVIIGTYSSLFIASPIMYLLDNKYNIKSEEEEISHAN